VVAPQDTLYAFVSTASLQSPALQRLRDGQGPTAAVNASSTQPWLSSIHTGCQLDTHQVLTSAMQPYRLYRSIWSPRATVTVLTMMQTLEANELNTPSVFACGHGCSCADVLSDAAATEGVRVGLRGRGVRCACLQGRYIQGCTFLNRRRDVYGKREEHQITLLGHDHLLQHRSGGAWTAAGCSCSGHPTSACA
jgi:hypothetical protein